MTWNSRKQQNYISKRTHTHRSTHTPPTHTHKYTCPTLHGADEDLVGPGGSPGLGADGLLYGIRALNFDPEISYIVRYIIATFRDVALSRLFVSLGKLWAIKIRIKNFVERNSQKYFHFLKVFYAYFNKDFKKLSERRIYEIFYEIISLFLKDSYEPFPPRTLSGRNLVVVVMRKLPPSGAILTPSFL